MPNTSPKWLIGFLMLSICAFSQNSFRHGTSIAIERTDEQIVIATDSRAIDENGKRLPDTCKIRTAGKWHLSLNGMASTKGIDVFFVVGKLLRHSGDIDDRSTAIVNSLTPLLNAVMQSDPVLREHAIAQGSLLGITIFGEEKKVLKLVSIKFVLADNGLISYERHACPGECSQNRGGVFVPSLDAPKFNWNIEPLTAVRAFVQMEIDQHLVDVGPPLQILQINPKARPKWIEQPAVCKDQK
jgi:hypothetical protein